MCLGVYRNSTQSLGSDHQVELPIVITTPHAEFEVAGDDKIFVLIGVHTLDRAASKLQAFYRKRRGVKNTQQAPTAVGAQVDPFSRSSISTYLGGMQQQSSTSSAVSLPLDANRKSMYAQESSMSFKNYFV